MKSAATALLLCGTLSAASCSARSCASDARQEAEIGTEAAKEASLRTRQQLKMIADGVAEGAAENVVELERYLTGRVAATRSRYEQGRTHLVVGGLYGVTANRLNVRDGPSRQSGRIIAQLRKRQVVKGLGFDDGWIEVEYGSSRRGWAYGRYLQDLSTAERGFEAFVTFRPVNTPIVISLNVLTGNISVVAASSMLTPVGSIGLRLEANQGDHRFLIIHHRDTTEYYDLHGETFDITLVDVKGSVRFRSRGHGHIEVFLEE